MFTPASQKTHCSFSLQSIDIRHLRVFNDRAKTLNKFLTHPD